MSLITTAKARRETPRNVPASSPILVIATSSSGGPGGTGLCSGTPERFSPDGTRSVAGGAAGILRGRPRGHRPVGSDGTGAAMEIGTRAGIDHPMVEPLDVAGRPRRAGSRAGVCRLPRHEEQIMNLNNRPRPTAKEGGLAWPLVGKLIGIFLF